MPDFPSPPPVVVAAEAKLFAAETDFRASCEAAGYPPSAGAV